MRDYRKYNTIEAKSFLMENKNIGLICMPSLEPKDAPNGIILDQNKYNFFLYNEDKIIHVKFNQPSFLIPKNEKI